MLFPAVVVGGIMALVFHSTASSSGGAEGFGVGSLSTSGRFESRPLFVPVDRPPPLRREATSYPGLRLAPPAQIAIPAVGLQAPVAAVGATRAGITVPPPSRTGWYDGGPRPGEPGRAVVIGHVDTATGPGVFFRLSRVRPGASISVTTRRGERVRFRVIGKREVEKARFPSEAVYGPTPQRMLVLVTCGGPWLPALRHYRDNVIVYARAG